MPKITRPTIAPNNLNAMLEAGIYYRLGNPNAPLNSATVKICHFPQKKVEEPQTDKNKENEIDVSLTD